MSAPAAAGRLNTLAGLLLPSVGAVVFAVALIQVLFLSGAYQRRAQHQILRYVEWLARLFANDPSGFRAAF